MIKPAALPARFMNAGESPVPEESNAVLFEKMQGDG